MKVWPKIHLICYPFLGNSTTHTTIVPLTKLDAVYRALISPDNLNPKLIPLARYYTVSEMMIFYFFLWVSRSQLLFQILIVLMITKGQIIVKYPFGILVHMDGRRNCETQIPKKNVERPPLGC